VGFQISVGASLVPHRPPAFTPSMPRRESLNVAPET
jgi:hypothetical protein